MYREYVQAMSTQNLKFWVFSNIADKLFATFSRTVQVESADTLSDSLAAWLAGSCQLVQIREATLASVRSLGSALFPGTSSTLMTALPIAQKPR